jgi:pimeloyl-ACP methyl ester carboxylesterase
MGFLPNLRMPTLFIRGEESDLVEREVLEKVALLLPKVHVVEVPRAGHAVPLDNPEETAQAINRFLLCECF